MANIGIIITIIIGFACVVFLGWFLNFKVYDTILPSIIDLYIGSEDNKRYTIVKKQIENKIGKLSGAIPYSSIILILILLLFIFIDRFIWKL